MIIKTYIRTLSGRKLSVIDPQPEDICLADIAAGISKEVRWNGQTETGYSVARHSINVSLCVKPEFQLEALLHDATEAYCGDVIKPLKLTLPDYNAAEYRFRLAIAAHFGLEVGTSETVHWADHETAKAEFFHLSPQYYEEDFGNEIINVSFGPRDFTSSPKHDEREFIQRFWEIKDQQE